MKLMNTSTIVAWMKQVIWILFAGGILRYTLPQRRSASRSARRMYRGVVVDELMSLHVPCIGTPLRQLSGCLDLPHCYRHGGEQA